MATHVVTIANSLRVFGIAPTDNWAAWNWNAFLWGEGTADLGITFIKMIQNSVTPDTAIGKTFTKMIENAMAVAADMSSERLYTGNGWAYVYPDRTTEAEGRDFVTWASGATASGSWSSQAVAATTWSQA